MSCVVLAMSGNSYQNGHTCMEGRILKPDEKIGCGDVFRAIHGR